ECEENWLGRSRHPTSEASHEADDVACSGSGPGGRVLGEHPRGPERRGRRPGGGGKSRDERSGISRAWSRGECESRAADFRKVRATGRQAAALCLYGEGRQVLRGGSRPIKPNGR